MAGERQGERRMTRLLRNRFQLQPVCCALSSAAAAALTSRPPRHSNYVMRRNDDAAAAVAASTDEISACMWASSPFSCRVATSCDIYPCHWWRQMLF